MLFPFHMFVDSFGDWTAARNGIYYVMRQTGKHLAKASINFFNFETRKTETAAELDRDPGSHSGLSLSPDGQWFVLRKKIFAITTFRSSKIFVKNLLIFIGFPL